MDNEKTSKVLIVDDNLANVKLLEKILRLDGYMNIMTITDPRQVKDVYAEQQPDVVLLDLNMPYMNGFEVMSTLAQNKLNDYLPVIVITAHDDHEHLKKALEMGARDFIGKPFNFEEVLLRIRNTLEVRLLHNKVKSYNQKLENRVEKRDQELEESKIELIRRLGRAAEYRDNETGDHLIRMSLYVRELALELGFSENEAELLQHASTMHDIGKIAIPDNILLKEGPLTEEERIVMQTHTAKGAEILSGGTSEILKLAEQIALHHHEKWDGTGYPNGLKGEEIPLYVRMVAICDVFDALTTKRPYKKKWSIEEAIQEIQKGAGEHFDPVLVESFQVILPRIKKIMDIY